MKYGYDVMSVDISNIALNKLRMTSLTGYLLIFLSDSETIKLITEIKKY